MKTITAILAAIVLTLNATAAAPASDMMYRAVYSLMGEKSHFDASGKLIATSRYISDAALPLPVIKKLMKKCPDFQIRYIREFEADGINTYVITLENASSFKIVRCGQGTLSVLQHLDKI